MLCAVLAWLLKGDHKRVMLLQETLDELLKHSSMHIACRHVLQVCNEVGAAVHQ
jgi:hypothetical protein